MALKDFGCICVGIVLTLVCLGVNLPHVCAILEICFYLRVLSGLGIIDWNGLSFLCITDNRAQVVCLVMRHLIQVINILSNLIKLLTRFQYLLHTLSLLVALPVLVPATLILDRGHVLIGSIVWLRCLKDLAIGLLVLHDVYPFSWALHVGETEKVTSLSYILVALAQLMLLLVELNRCPVEGEHRDVGSLCWLGLLAAWR